MPLPTQEITAVALALDRARLRTLADNLVNAQTPGFKRAWADASASASGATRTSNADHTDPMAAALRPGAGTPAQALLDLRPAALRATGHGADLAIDGDGWFELATPDGPAYTRRGDFQTDAQGRLVTRDGHPVQAQEGALAWTPNARVAADGTVRDGDRVLGQLRVVRFDGDTTLQRDSQGLLRSAIAPQLATGARVRQGHLEAANTDTAGDMVRLMETLRHSEALHRVVQGLDDLHERTLRKLGEF